MQPLHGHLKPETVLIQHGGFGPFTRGRTGERKRSLKSIRRAELIRGEDENLLDETRAAAGIGRVDGHGAMFGNYGPAG